MPPRPVWLVNQDRSAKSVHISQYEFHSTQRSSACNVGLDRLRPNFIRCQPALHLMLHLLQAARREHLLRAERQEPRKLAGIYPRRLPYRGQEVSNDARMAGSSLSCAFPLQSYARHQQPSTQACGTSVCVVPSSWSTPLSCSELHHDGKKRERRMRRWTRRQQQLAREGIDKEPQEPTDKLGVVGLSMPLLSSLAPLSRLLHSCSILSSRPNRPCLGAHAQPRDWIVQQRVVSSPSALTPTLNFPIKSRHNLPVTTRYVSTLQCSHGRPSILFLLLQNHSFSDRKCPTTTAHTRRDQGWPPFLPSRGMCRHGLAAGWVPIPVSTLAHHPPPPGASPIYSSLYPE